MSALIVGHCNACGGSDGFPHAPDCMTILATVIGEHREELPPAPPIIPDWKNSVVRTETPGHPSTGMSDFIRDQGLDYEDPENGISSVPYDIALEELPPAPITLYLPPDDNPPLKVECDESCGAREFPQTFEEVKASYIHWKDHSLYSGCSHAR